MRAELRQLYTKSIHDHDVAISERSIQDGIFYITKRERRLGRRRMMVAVGLQPMESDLPSDLWSIHVADAR